MNIDLPDHEYVSVLLCWRQHCWLTLAVSDIDHSVVVVVVAKATSYSAALNIKNKASLF